MPTKREDEHKDKWAWVAATYFERPTFIGAHLALEPAAQTVRDLAERLEVARANMDLDLRHMSHTTIKPRPDEILDAVAMVRSAAAQLEAAADMIVRQFPT